MLDVGFARVSACAACLTALAVLLSVNSCAKEDSRAPVMRHDLIPVRKVARRDFGDVGSFDSTKTWILNIDWRADTKCVHFKVVRCDSSQPPDSWALTLELPFVPTAACATTSTEFFVAGVDGEDVTLHRYQIDRDEKQVYIKDDVILRSASMIGIWQMLDVIVGGQHGMMCWDSAMVTMSWVPASGGTPLKIISSADCSRLADVGAFDKRTKLTDHGYTIVLSNRGPECAADEPTLAVEVIDRDGDGRVDEVKVDESK